MSHLHARVLYTSRLARIADIACRAPTSPRGAEEYASSHHVLFTRRGVFVKHQGRRQLVAEAAHVLFFNRHEPFRVSHPADGGDDCTMITCPDQVWLELLSRHDPSVVDRPLGPFRIGHARATTQILLAYHALRHMARVASGSDLAVEEETLRLLEAILKPTHADHASTHRARRPETRAARADLAAYAKLLLAADPAHNHSLGDLAAATNSSPYHLARVFHQELGLPIHRYLTRLRFALALTRLFEGQESLSAVAHALGFASHSHFTTAFRREFGMTPSSVRRLRRSQLAAFRPYLSTGKARARDAVGR